MKSTPMRREFSFNGLKLPDPNPQMSVEEVRGVLSMQYPEIATASSGVTSKPTIEGHFKTDQRTSPWTRICFTSPAAVLATPVLI